MTANMLRSIFFLPLALLLLLTACDSVEDRAQGHHQKGIELLEAGQPKQAALEFRNALELNQEFVEPRFELAKIEESDRQFSFALRNYLKILELDPNHVGALVRAANIFIIGGHAERALTHINQAYKIAPTDVDVLVTRAFALLRNGEFAEAVQMAREAQLQAPAEPKIGLILATDLIRQGKEREGLVEIDRFLEVNRADIPLNILKIRVLEQLGEKEKLSAHLENMSKLYPNNTEIHEILAKWYISESQFDNAERALRKLQVINPNSSDATRNLVQFISDTRGDAAAREEVLAQIQRAGSEQQKVDLTVLLAEMDYKNKDIEAAYERLRTLIASQEDATLVIPAHLVLGQFKAAEGRFDEALQFARNVLAVDAKNATALGLSAAIHSEQGNHEQAVLDIRAAMNENPRDPKLRRLAAQIYSRNGNNDLAMESLATTVVLSGYDPKFAQEYASMLRTAGQTRAIEAVLTETVRRNPRNRELLAALAAARLRLQDWSGAEQAAAALRQLDSGDQAEQIRAMVLTGQQRYGESIELLQRLSESDGDNASIMAALTQVYIKAGQTGQARAYIDRVLAQSPDNTAALRISGALHALSDDLETAEQFFRQAVLADPQDPISFIVLGRFLRDHDRLIEAEEVVRAGVANVPGNVSLHIHLADFLLQRGEFEQAIQEFEVVYDLQPDSLVAANNLASMLADFHANNPDLVDRAYSIAQRLAGSNNPAHMDTYGWILYLRGEYTLALRSLRPAAEQLPNNPWVQYHAGMAYAKLNQPAMARRHLQAALDSGGSHMFPLREQAQAALDGLPTQ